MTPLVSILIPAFNAARWIRNTLESALAQTHPRVEIIVVDDGSTDATVSIARSLSGLGVRVAIQPNAGAAAARNHALRLCAGDFIQFLDADDLLSPEKITVQIKRLTSRTSHSVAAGPWGRFQEDMSASVFTSEENWRDLPTVEWLRLNFSGRGMMPPVAWLTPRAVIDAAGPWDESLSLNDDGEYFTRVLLAAKDVLFCPEARSYYRSGRVGSLSHSRTRSAWDSALRSQLACTRHLLAVDNSPSSRLACANLLARLAYAMYPDQPDLVASAEAAARELGGSNLAPEGGHAFRIATRLLGWKLARRLQASLGRRPV